MSTAPLICLSLTGPTIRDNLLQLERYRPHIDLAELRADLLEPAELGAVRRFPALAGVPVVLSIRREPDGGRFGGGEGDRRALLESAFAARERGFAYLELEEGVPVPPGAGRAVREGGTRIIRARYHGAGVPAGLRGTLRTLARGSEIPKTVTAPGSTAELLALYDCARTAADGSDRSGDRILYGTGPFGFPSRVLARRFGSCLVYTEPVGPDDPPGVLDPETLAVTYRFRELNESTRLFGIIGNPVMHSRSPAIHNPAFARLRQNAVYVPFPLDDIALFPPLAEAFGIEGLSVTVPHKERVIPYLVGTDEGVARTGACNTVVRGDRGFHGFNTDVYGFLAPLAAALRSREAGTAGTEGAGGGKQPPPAVQSDGILSGRAASVIGAGGAARSVVYALRSEGASVLVLNRTPERAARLADEFGCSWAPLDAAGFAAMERFRDIVVQTTTAGMTPHEEEDPAAGYRFTGAEIAYDIVYHPPLTRFLSRAKEAGCTVIGGAEMLLHQGFRQFFLFTGLPYPEP